jgi:uncharacterized membrane protein (DUF485 family)
VAQFPCIFSSDISAGSQFCDAAAQPWVRRHYKGEKDMSESVKRYEADKTEWARIAETREFKDLMATKKTFIIPAFIFFLVYYFLLPILVGYAPQFMETRVIGVVNLAYLFALSQFFMAWTVAWLYVRAANNFDKLAEDIIKQAENNSPNKPEVR